MTTTPQANAIDWPTTSKRHMTNTGDVVRVQRGRVFTADEIEPGDFIVSIGNGLCHREVVAVRRLCGYVVVTKPNGRELNIRPDVKVTAWRPVMGPAF